MMVRKKGTYRFLRSPSSCALNPLIFLKMKMVRTGIMMVKQ